MIAVVAKGVVGKIFANAAGAAAIDGAIFTVVALCIVRAVVHDTRSVNAFTRAVFGGAGGLVFKGFVFTAIVRIADVVGAWIIVVAIGIFQTTGNALAIFANAFPFVAIETVRTVWHICIAASRFRFAATGGAGVEIFANCERLAFRAYANAIAFS